MPNERLALLLILLLSALLAVPAKAALPPVATPSAAPLLPQAFAADEAEEDEAQDDESSEAEVEDEALESEECELGEDECEAEAGDEEECLLTAAQATVSSGAHANRIRVAIRYTAFRPAAVAVSYQVRGGGGVRLGSAQAHFARKGVFHDTIAVSDRELAQVSAAREVAIGLHALNTPAYCRQVFQQHLTPKRTGSRLLFS
jgi:hypothetical protein